MLDDGAGWETDGCRAMVEGWIRGVGERGGGGGGRPI